MIEKPHLVLELPLFGTDGGVDAYMRFALGVECLTFVCLVVSIWSFFGVFPPVSPASRQDGGSGDPHKQGVRQRRQRRQRCFPNLFNILLLLTFLLYVYFFFF